MNGTFTLWVILRIIRISPESRGDFFLAAGPILTGISGVFFSGLVGAGRFRAQNSAWARDVGGAADPETQVGRVQGVSHDVLSMGNWSKTSQKYVIKNFSWHPPVKKSQKMPKNAPKTPPRTP